MSFLCQWVSATSSGLDQTALLRLAGFLLAMEKYLCPELPTFWKSSPFSLPFSRLAKFLAMAISVAKQSGALWKCSPLARHGEMVFA